MPKLPTITHKKLLKVLEKSGFQIDHTTGSHFIFYNKMNKKRVTIPFHRKELAKGTLMSILREAGISRKELIKLLRK
jgi:predicted RNA binding protein YcfA (HicA-like mRNA interferase family)